MRTPAKPKSVTQIMAMARNLPAESQASAKQLDPGTAEVVNALFKELQAIFPAWKQAWPDGEALKAAKRSWIKSFVAAGINTLEQIRFGIQKCRVLGTDFAPSSGKFIKLCQPTPEEMGIPPLARALAEVLENFHPSRSGCRVWTHEAKGEISGKDAALLADSIVHKLLHAQLSPRHWNALVAKYSTHKGRKIDSIGRLVAAVPTSAPKRFTQQAVLVWAIPQQTKGIQRKAPQFEAPEPRENEEERQWDWRNKAAAAAVERANKNARAVAEVKAGEMIVLAESNYDMTNWDSQGLTERTYQRWNKAIKNSLESMVNEALVDAQHMLEAVGVLSGEAA